MANMSLKKNPMPAQAPEVRNRNFDEVALGYTAEQAVDEAKRCLACKHKPCSTSQISGNNFCAIEFWNTLYYCSSTFCYDICIHFYEFADMFKSCFKQVFNYN